MGLNENAAARLREMVAAYRPGTDEALMSAALRLGAKWRSQMIANTIRSMNGSKVMHGPFAGMDYAVAAAEGALAARLIGSYESELHPYLLAFLNAGLDHVVDIGCAEGYYAVGLARLAPQVAVHAYDISEEARRLCTALAAANGVSDRVTVGAEFKGEDFAAFADKRSLVICDIEGGETELLDPERWPALKRLAMIVETHPHLSPRATEILIERFAPSHAFTLVHQAPKATPTPDWLKGLGHLDSLLAVWEWRAQPTPWLVMKPKV